MLVKRDFLDILQAKKLLEAVVLWGPRQVGKTTLLDQLPLKSRLFLDDLATRQLAQSDPGLSLEQLALPTLIDEVQYAPNLLPEIKRRIDEARRKRLKTANSPAPQTDYYLTGSNRLLLDHNVKESLAGRCHLFTLHGLSLKEIFDAFDDLGLKQVLFRGGFPELYARRDLDPIQYLNDYILSFVEKDVALSGGVEKLGEFHTVLRLLSARTGQFLNVNEVAQTSGVSQKTVQHWLDMLQRNFLVVQVPTFSTNLSKRVVKMKKFYFLDVGLCVRLQGHVAEDPMWHAPQIGGLFETLVHAEIIKTRDNFLRDWQIFAWRTKEKAEIDFILQGAGKTLFIEAKLAIHGARPFSLDPEALKVFKPPFNKIVVTAGDTILPLDRETTNVPVKLLGRYLLDEMS